MGASRDDRIKNNKESSILDSYRMRQCILIIVDICIVIIAFFISAWTTEQYLVQDKIILPLITYIILNILSLVLFKGYTSLWRDSGDIEIINLAISSLVVVWPLIFINRLIDHNFSDVFYIVSTLLILLLTCSSRIVYRVARRVVLHMVINVDKTASRTLIVGGGSAGALIIREIYENTQLEKLTVGVVDDDKSKLGKKIQGVPILGMCKDIKMIVDKYNIEEIIFSIANISMERKQEIINICQGTKCKVKTIPGIFEIIDGIVDIKKIRDVNIEDLLGREPVKINIEEISEYLKYKTILVTGGGGSIGSELCRQISKFNPKKLILLDIYENGVYEVQQELITRYKDKLDIEVIIASVRDEQRVESIFKQYKPEVVFHAAAHKHVPLMEKNKCEAIKNNIFGTINVAKMSDKYKVKRFVLISTDKAVNPTNIMGATKRCAEMIIQDINSKSETEFVAVRFGNVLGSNGSVIPLFKKQIEQGGPITVTHPEVTRYFMTIPEAVSLVMQAGSMAKGGEIFVLNMGDSVKIVDLAKNLISLSGFEPEVDIKIEFSGLRPGEKLYEELLMEEEGLEKTNHNKIFIGKQVEINQEHLKMNLNILKRAIDNEAGEVIEPIMKNIVTTFIREEIEKNEVATTV